MTNHAPHGSIRPTPITDSFQTWINKPGIRQNLTGQSTEDALEVAFFMGWDAQKRHDGLPSGSGESRDIGQELLQKFFSGELEQAVCPKKFFAAWERAFIKDFGFGGSPCPAS